MFGSLAKAIAAMAAEMVPVLTPVSPYGRAPRKIKMSGPPAEYPEGAAGNAARMRAIGRFHRWSRANPGKKPRTSNRELIAQEVTDVHAMLVFLKDDIRQASTDEVVAAMVKKRKYAHHLPEVIGGVLK